jgi:small multidrug resistance family-3 protein
MALLKSILFFLLAGLCEIGGGYLIWIWWKESKSGWFALIGAILLVAYGIVPTFQPGNFGRVYAAYGGVFVVLSLLWSWQIDHVVPDRFDLLGGLVVLLGVAIIMYWPRN